jgi:hypothetical protein
MPFRLKRIAEPLSLAARTDTAPHPGRAETDVVILAHSQAESVLGHEMSRYCDGLVRGRSFLIAGHRGSGKTTMVDHVLFEHQKQALAHRVRFKPLPVYVHGPLIFGERTMPAKPTATTEPAAPTAAPVLSGPAAFALAMGRAPAVAAESKPVEAEGIQQRALLQVAQALHQAVAKEYSDRFHLLARRRHEAASSDADELSKLAARFQIELPEAPPAPRLADFWRVAGAERDGVLFDPGHRHGAQQGLREMVALTGISHVYQRISGKLEEAETQGRGDTRKVDVQSGIDLRWSELAKPLSALAAGGAAGGVTVASGHPLAALFVSVLVALGAGLVFKATTTTSMRQERKIDRTFLPDLSTKTLHRVMPEMFERLLAAGLAPVFVVDELDKVDDLYSQIHELLDTMKKLFSERAFTCLLTDRGFYEQLHVREEQERAGALATVR